MREGFNQRQPVGAFVDFALEQGLETLGGGLWGVKMRHQTFQRAVMVIDQLAHTHGQACEGQFMAPQNKVIFARVVLQTLAGFKPVADGIGLGFGGVDPDI